MFARANKKKIPTGRIYLLRMILDDKEVVHKIGMCYTPRSTDRMMEILRSWFMKYRYVPETRLRLDHETKTPYELEKHIHDVLSDFKWMPDKKVDGRQEMFKGFDEEEVIAYIKTFEIKEWVAQ